MIAMIAPVTWCYQRCCGSWDDLEQCCHPSAAAVVRGRHQGPQDAFWAGLVWGSAAGGVGRFTAEGGWGSKPLAEVVTFMPACAARGVVALFHTSAVCWGQQPCDESLSRGEVWGRPCFAVARCAARCEPRRGGGVPRRCRSRPSARCPAGVVCWTRALPAAAACKWERRFSEACACVRGGSTLEQPREEGKRVFAALGSGDAPLAVGQLSRGVARGPDARRGHDAPAHPPQQGIDGN